MVKANELRIGNWIMDDDSLYSKIIGVKPFDWSVRCDESEGCELLIDVYRNDDKINTAMLCNSDEATPIPLTPEILEKCGFKQHHDDCCNDIIYIKSIYGKPPFVWGIYQSSGVMINKAKWISSLHELQNIIFALTGEELKVSL